MSRSEQLPPAVRAEQGGERALLLLEVLDRIELPPPSEVPDVAAVDATGVTSWRIPNTDITIAQTAEGPYAGEFQFTAHTVRSLPAFYERSKHLPYKPGALVGIYEDTIYAPGPWLRPELTANLPSFAYVVVQGQTVWQWLAALATLGLTTAVVVLVYLLGRRVDDGSRDSGPRRHFGRMIATLVAIHLIYLTSRFLDEGINITGTSLFVLELGLRCLD